MTNSIKRIQEIIEQEKRISPREIREKLNISQVLTHRHLKTLCEKKIIRKMGTPPKVFYTPNIENKNKKLSSEIIENNWLEIMPNGEFLYGESGFMQWCKKRNLDPHTQKETFETMFREKESYKQNGLLNATTKIQQSFKENHLETLWYVDFYSWEVFGKTVLGKLVLYAKQNSDRELMEEIALRTQSVIKKYIDREKFDMICVIPHSVPRKKNFLQSTLRFLNLNPNPKQVFQKVFSGHSVAQKTLKSKAEREENAEKTLILNTEYFPFFPPKILLIDDACGSGSTLNIAAKKIHEVSPKTKIHGLTFVGSLKGFDVIAES